MFDFTVGDGTRVQHHHVFEVGALHQIKWVNQFDAGVRNFIVAAAEPALHDSPIPAISIRIGMHHRCMAIHIWAMEMFKMNKIMRHSTRSVSSMRSNQNVLRMTTAENKNSLSFLNCSETISIKLIYGLKQRLMRANHIITMQ